MLRAASPGGRGQTSRAGQPGSVRRRRADPRMVSYRLALMKTAISRSTMLREGWEEKLCPPPSVSR